MYDRKQRSKKRRICNADDGKEVCIAGVQLSAGVSPLKVVPPADRRGAKMKAPSERAPRGKYAGDVLECSKQHEL